ncbi:MAG: bifunctional diaminohydroxyphosphoribosylaminopyrimidine deaminase/5-amino-6-(5-phosphoribosylamino)uracil reductase RibD [Planctomycetota bacterium]|nr:MAG: bifunctional diaminohydroxyphosphoribosylaminopyrimidine deaminase/5-amino-6-(5-phosphoribosylamino)uracil reductase RibD [Planctomycetota bacterium]
MHKNTEDERYMRMALNLAARGFSVVEPNPMVGCVIVKSNQIIGKGFHKKFGGPHAEINAIDDCKTIGAKPAGATMYITLEPCSHHGKTPPCTEAIIEAAPARVVVAAIDPSEHAQAKGIGQMRNAGIQVDVGICGLEAKLLNAGFLKFAGTKRPWVILKWAQSLDGKLAPAGDTAKGEKWISNELSRKDVHRLRRSVQAILVGINTVRADDPMLTPRPPKGKKPVRVVLDADLQIPLTSRLLRTTKSFPVIIIAGAESGRTNPTKVARIEKKGAELVFVPAFEGKCDLEATLAALGDRGIAQLLVEGGAGVITSFLSGGFADAVRVYIAPKILGRAGKTSIADSLAQLINEAPLYHVNINEFEGDVCVTGMLKKLED